MPTWLLPVIAGVVIVVLVGGSMYELHAVSYSDGQSTCQAQQATAQVSQDQTTKAGYAQIDHNTPVNANKRTAIKWLSRYTTNNSK